jgi:hypothetical protein
MEGRRPIFTKTRRYSLQPTATSSSGDDDPGHDHAMSDGMREVKLHGCHMVKGMAIGQRHPEKLQKAITFKPELDFGKGFSRWEECIKGIKIWIGAMCPSEIDEEITCIPINEMFYNTHVLTTIITCTFLAELEVHKETLVIIWGLELWNMLKDLTSMRKSS